MTNGGAQTTEGNKKLRAARNKGNWKSLENMRYQRRLLCVLNSHYCLCYSVKKGQNVFLIPFDHDDPVINQF